MTLKQMVAQSENLFISQQRDGTFFPGLESCVISSGLTLFSLKFWLNLIVMILQCPVWDVESSQLTDVVLSQGRYGCFVQLQRRLL